MAVTLTDFKDYVRATGTSDDAFIQKCLDEAAALVERFNVAWDSSTETYVASAAPTAAVDRAVTECASELFHRRNAPNGLAQFASFDGAPVRVARDPMIGARAILAPWVVSGI